MFSDAAEESSVLLRLKRVSGVFHPGEVVEGTIVVDAPKNWDFKRIKLHATGRVTFSDSSVPAVELLHEDIDVQQSSGQFPEGLTEIPFEFPLRGVESTPLLETYHGVYVTICYQIHLDVERGLLQKDIHNSAEFVLETPSSQPPSQPVHFVLTPEVARSGETSEAARRRMDQIPDFQLRGCLHASSTPLDSPLTGEVVVDRCAMPIQSVECQLIRIETVVHTKKGVKQKEQRTPTEIQNLQIADGNLCCGLVVPIYLVLPRLFSCPSMTTQRFSVEFALSIILTLADGLTVTQTNPITLYRADELPAAAAAAADKQSKATAGPEVESAVVAETHQDLLLLDFNE